MESNLKNIYNDFGIDVSTLDVEKMNDQTLFFLCLQIALKSEGPAIKNAKYLFRVIRKAGKYYR
jgi:hypothetical protein